MLFRSIESVAKIGPSFISATESNPAGWGLNVPALPTNWIASPTFDSLFKFDLVGGFSAAGAVTAALLIFTLLITDFFDTMGTMTAIGAEAGLLDNDGNVPN